MRRMAKVFSLTAILCLVFAMMQITAFAATASSAIRDESSASLNAVSENAAVSGTASENAASQNAVSENSLAAAGVEDIEKINVEEGAAVNPGTGAENLAIPGVVALIAAATAATTIAGKKK